MGAAAVPASHAVCGSSLHPATRPSVPESHHSALAKAENRGKHGAIPDMDTPMQRRHDIDALRVFAFALLILYHASGVYQTNSDFNIVSTYQYDWIEWARIVLNRWRMPLLFAISGIAIGMYQPTRGPLRFAGNRTWRLLLPLVFGMLFIVPIQCYCEAVRNGAVPTGFGHFMHRYLQLKPWPDGGWGGSSYGVTWNHLWYLAYLWVYTMILLVLLPVLESRIGKCFQAWLATRSLPWMILVPTALFFSYLWQLLPRFGETHALAGDWYMHAEYASVFLFGYLVSRQASFWERVANWRWTTLPVAVLGITIELSLKAVGRGILVPTHVPEWMFSMPWEEIEHVGRALYMWTALLTIFGWGYRWLNRPFRWLPYATEAVYPWYILHQSLIVLLAYWLIPLNLGGRIESALVIGGTIAGCLLLHECVIRRVGFLRPLFGLKRKCNSNLVGGVHSVPQSTA